MLIIIQSAKDEKDRSISSLCRGDGFVQTFDLETAFNGKDRISVLSETSGPPC